MRPSTSSCVRMRPRDAPTARRVATSRRRSSARASSIAATLLHAISSTSTVSPPSMAMKPTTGPASGAGTRAERAPPRRPSARRDRRFARSGRSRMMRRARRAPAAVETPGSSRPMRGHPRPTRDCRGANARWRGPTRPWPSGTQKSAPRNVVPVNPASATPTTVYGRLLRRMVCPTIVRIRLEASRPELMTQHDDRMRARGAIFLGRKNRPGAGRVPTTSK